MFFIETTYFLHALALSEPQQYIDDKVENAHAAHRNLLTTQGGASRLYINLRDGIFREVDILGPVRVFPSLLKFFGLYLSAKRCGGGYCAGRVRFHGHW